jgi:hypothetical protein
MANIRIIFFDKRFALNDAMGVKLHWCFFLNALAVDTVLIAIFWQSLISEAFDIELEYSRQILLGAGVWLGYSADRILDGFQITDRICSARHFIAFRFRHFLSLTWVFVLMLAISFAYHALSVMDLYKCSVLVIFCVLNSLVNTFDKFGNFPIPKELRTSVLFASGVFLFVLSGCPKPVTWSWITFLAFTCLCFTNCCYTAAWDRVMDLQQGQSSLMLRRKPSLGFMNLLSFSIVFFSIALSFFAPTHLRLFFLAIGMAVLTHPLVDILICGSEHKRLVADLGLILSAACCLL